MRTSKRLQPLRTLQASLVPLAFSLLSVVSAATPADVDGASERPAIGATPAPMLDAEIEYSFFATASDVRASTLANSIFKEPDSRVRGRSSVTIFRVASPAVVMVVSEDGIGSGAVLNAAGDIVTNLHVVGKSKSVGIIFKQEAEGAPAGKATTRPARVIKTDPVTDLAIVRVPSLPNGIEPLRLGTLADVMVGSDVHAIGHPTGQSWTYTRGYVSAIRRDFSWRSQHRATVIQTQTPINPGNSGGPLINEDGLIVGINSFKATSGEGLNFAVAVDHVRTLIASSVNASAERSPLPAAAICNKEPKVVYTRRNKRDDADIFGYDVNCTGAAEFEIHVPDAKEKPTAWVFDRNRDNIPDVIVFDEGRDGKFDISFHDTDFDKKWDLIGYHPDGKITPTRFETYKQ